MKKLAIILFLLSSISLAKENKQLKVAIIDTGLNILDERFSNVVCPAGHWNYVDNNANVTDTHFHGTHIAGLIKRHSKNSNYCLLIYKFYSEYKEGNILRSKHALLNAVEVGSDIINMSFGGPGFDEIEYNIIKNNPKITFIVSAGNDAKELNKNNYYYYPASYNLPNMIVVGALGEDNKRNESSNYGDIVDRWEIGQNVMSFVPSGSAFMTGTSQATAIATGKFIYVQHH